MPIERPNRLFSVTRRYPRWTSSVNTVHTCSSDGTGCAMIIHNLRRKMDGHSPEIEKKKFVELNTRVFDTQTDAHGQKNGTSKLGNISTTAKTKKAIFHNPTDPSSNSFSVYINVPFFFR